MGNGLITAMPRGSFKTTVAQDLRRYGSPPSFGFFVTCYFQIPGFKYTFWMRLTHFLKHLPIVFRPFYYACRFILHRQSVRYGIQIPYRTRIGPGLYIGHFGGIVVNPDAMIGCNCNISHGVTIGARYGGKRPGIPVIGDRVYLAPGCKVIGGISVGNDVAVGANAVVVDSIPDSVAVAGVPAKIVSIVGSANYIVINSGT